MAVWAASSSLITLCGQAWGAGNKELTGVRERMRAFCCVAFTTDIPRFHRSFHAREHRLHFEGAFGYHSAPVCALSQEAVTQSIPAHQISCSARIGISMLPHRHLAAVRPGHHGHFRHPRVHLVLVPRLGAPVQHAGPEGHGAGRAVRESAGLLHHPVPRLRLHAPVLPGVLYLTAHLLSVLALGTASIHSPPLPLLLRSMRVPFGRIVRCCCVRTFVSNTLNQAALLRGLHMPSPAPALHRRVHRGQVYAGYWSYRAVKGSLIVCYAGDRGSLTLCILLPCFSP